jgi:phosphoglycerol transferase MdoB-like AlkP superfamily enzyme
VPLLIRVPGDNPPKGEIKTRSGQTDLAPTLLALLGIDPAPLPFMGRNILGSPGPSVLPRPYGDWLASDYALMAQGAQSKRRQACYDITEMERVSVGRCAADDEEVRRQREVSSLVIRYDLQQRLSEAGVQGGHNGATDGPH